MLTVLGALAWQGFERVPCDGFGCLGPALIAVVTIPLGATLLGWIVLRGLGVPRPFLVAALTMGSAWLLGFAPSLPDPLEAAYWAVPAVFAAAWTWALAPSRGWRPGLLLGGGLAVLAVAGLFWDQWSFERAAEQRLDATDAPQLIIDDDRWQLISTDVRPESFGTLYERDDDVRLSVTAAAPAPDADPATDCGEVTGPLFDNPADACVDVGDGLWETRAGSLTQFVVLREDAVVGFEALYPDELTRDQVELLAAALRESNGAEIRDLLRD